MHELRDSDVLDLDVLDAGVQEELLAQHVMQQTHRGCLLRPEQRCHVGFRSVP